MNHQPHPYQTGESQFFEQWAHYATKGKYGFVKSFWQVLTTLNTMLLAVFIRKRMGVRIANRGSWLFIYFYLLILFTVDILSAEVDPATGLIVDDTQSAGLIVLHGLAYIVFSLWRRAGALRRMFRIGRRNNRPVGSTEIGDSVIYPVLRFFLRPLGLAAREGRARRFWQLSESRWMQFWEPALIGYGGYQLWIAGYDIYGKMLLFAALCLFNQTKRAYLNTARARQARIDANLGGQIIRPAPSRRHSRRIIQ